VRRLQLALELAGCMPYMMLWMGTFGGTSTTSIWHPHPDDLILTCTTLL
jgi:hypothetical protein